jgi:hypothetical protein
MNKLHRPLPLIVGVVPLAFAAVAAQAQTAAPAQKVNPPVAQAWIDVATFSGMGMPMGGGGMGGNPMAAIGSLLGGGSGGGANNNSFGLTQSGAAGRYIDVTLATRNNPALADAQQAVPAGFLSPALKLQAPPAAKPAPETEDDVVPHDTERPRGRILMYWGCGSTVRPGQPLVLDAASATAADFARFFQSRRATQRGAHSAAGRPVWPSKADTRMVPAGASLVGEHTFSGSGVPDGFRFQIPAQQDLMPVLELQQADNGGATDLRWAAAPTARAYFVAAMGAGAKEEMILWSSSEQPDVGFGLVDYQTNAAVDRWLREKVLLAPATTTCTIPKGVFSGQGAMLRLIGYGSELNLAHPPRPSDARQPWNPQWAVKVRVKSVAQSMLGMPEMGMGAPATAGETAPQQSPDQPKKPGALDLLKGILGR